MLCSREHSHRKLAEVRAESTLEILHRTRKHM